MSAGGGRASAPYVDVRETHIGAVFLVGERAYKLKKPVSLGFLDFSTREARLAACRREVTLNRRLAPDVYLGVTELSDPAGGAPEPLVVMRRMPEDRRLSTLVRGGVDVEEDVRRIAHLLASFHSRCERSPEISVEGGRDALRERWRASFAQVRPFHGRVLDADVALEVERLTERFLEGRDVLFAERAAGGYVVDGHGDLLAEDVFCLPDGPRVLDCLEFDDRLRWLDQIDDAAFLAMDLEHLGAEALAGRFVGWYVDFAGDPAPASLVHHYVAYRAFVRAKVSCVRFDQGEAPAADEARSFTNLAYRHLADGRVTLVLVGGLPGTGKSTLAEGLADRLGLCLLSSDRIRKELAGVAPDQSAASAYRTGIYDPAHTGRTYSELLARAEHLLRMGESVVLDASWTDPQWRAAANALASRTVADVVPLWCELPAELAAARMRGRRGPSDADAAVAAAMRRHTAPWPEATVVYTLEPPDVVAERTVGLVRHGSPQLRGQPGVAPG